MRAAGAALILLVMGCGVAEAGKLYRCKSQDYFALTEEPKFTKYPNPYPQKVWEKFLLDTDTGSMRVGDQPGVQLFPVTKGGPGDDFVGAFAPMAASLEGAIAKGDIVRLRDWSQSPPGAPPSFIIMGPGYIVVGPCEVVQ